MADTNRGEIHEILLQLLRKAVDSSYQMEMPEGADWTGVLDLASGQGVIGLAAAGIEAVQGEWLKVNGSSHSEVAKQSAPLIPKVLLLQWIGLSEMQRQQYEQAWRVACRLDRLWATEGIHATVLKGRAIAKYYPVPSHRYSCDLDVFIGEEWGRACELLESQGVRLEHEVYKEVEFTLDNVYVECHRYITPIRGNEHLKAFERYLRTLLDGERKVCFEGTTLVCPPLMFTVMLYIEHALGDLLHGHLTLKHVVDWVVLRRQDFDREELVARCREFRFDRFLPLMDAFADVVEGKKDYGCLEGSYKETFDELFKAPVASSPRSWFGRRVELFFSILRNGKKYRRFGYTSMPSFLFNGVWAHFFRKEVEL